MNEIGLPLLGKMVPVSPTLLKILVGEEEPTSGEINKKKIFLYLT